VILKKDGSMAKLLDSQGLTTNQAIMQSKHFTPSEV